MGYAFPVDPLAVVADVNSVFELLVILIPGA